VANTHVALKIVKSAPDYTDAAEDEIEILKKIAEHDSAGDKHVIHLLDHFYHRGPHGKRIYLYFFPLLQFSLSSPIRINPLLVDVCMVFEALGCSLLDLIKRARYQGLPLPIVKRITRQVLVGLDYLHQLAIIHTDLKPENALVVEDPSVQPNPISAQQQQRISGDKQRQENASDNSAKLTKNQRRKLRLKQREGKGDDEKPDVDPTSQDSGGVAETSTATNGTDAHESTDTAAPATDNNGNGSSSVPQREDGEKQSDSSSEPSDSSSNHHRSRKKQNRPPLPSDPSCYNVKIVDFGNACWVHKHFTSDIQTRQYRSLEGILSPLYY